MITAAAAAAAAVKSLQSCPTLCDPIDDSPTGSPVPGILQARTLEWVAISFSKAWKWKVKVKSLSRVWLLATQWTAAYQAPPSMGFSRQEYWSEVPFLVSMTTQTILSELLCAILWVFLMGLIVKNLPAMQENGVWLLGWRDPLEKGVTTHYCILVWRIPWTEEPGGLKILVECCVNT